MKSPRMKPTLHSFQFTDYPGEGKRIYVHTRLDVFYFQFLEEIDEEDKETIGHAHSSIKAVIWGALLLEARVNDYLWRHISKTFPNERQKKSIWESLRMSKIFEKLDILISVSNRSKEDHSQELSKLTGLFELRNRLAHYKDLPTEVNDRIIKKSDVGKTLIEIMNSFPETRIIRELTSKPTRERIDDILDLISWLDELAIGDWAKAKQHTLLK